MNDDDIERILGADLFEELSSLGEIFDHRAAEPFAHLHHAELADMANQNYVFMFPFVGEAVINLVSALHHSAETNCEECDLKLAYFIGTLVGEMWTAMQIDWADHNDTQL